jgi:dTDP-D-glucose 4,6-dehydratase
LGWKPVWNFDQTIRETAHWYLQDRDQAKVSDVTIEQIQRYETHAAKTSTAWAV